ncbi:hypothetical protein R1flu_028488 [Riccia fluitans]|uniref:Uncharacterized protein n=1 Tax=Riccia fluitans TaxID=41844 RepID=A0ABD1XLX5_9MARC
MFSGHASVLEELRNKFKEQEERMVTILKEHEDQKEEHEKQKVEMATILKEHEDQKLEMAGLHKHIENLLQLQFLVVWYSAFKIVEDTVHEAVNMSLRRHNALAKRVQKMLISSGKLESRQIWSKYATLEMILDAIVAH